MLWLTLPEVPVTVSVEVPCGVPFGVLFGVDVPLLPPQPISTNAKSAIAVGRAMVGFSRRSATRQASMTNRTSAKSTGKPTRMLPNG